MKVGDRKIIFFILSRREGEEMKKKCLDLYTTQLKTILYSWIPELNYKLKLMGKL